MSDILIMIRNEAGVAMTSVEGEAIIALVKKDELIYDEQPVNLRFADAHFYNLPLGTYLAVAKHPALNPPEAEQEVTLTVREILVVRYIYLEPERQLLTIQVTSESLD
ncbi:hypothetical protein MC7420_7746 [Coleofasciculus chthonoplastes PCC 7420]|jgi:hypothetical protein|uniref:Uncharacterized protein n=1 Tax=Coleofasciculus chthonoplastes PCC 7420 TaxID=118168 RepID=B4VIM0_9CYAN|nr:hypothetical protein [Coleofasciculus chthonoplastes]EDX78008.1 hypothetical protein MC7420_7746 [Coleofasciculus chthonoplastes PCC 7420]